MQSAETGEDERAAQFAAWIGPHLPMMRSLAGRLASVQQADDLVQDALAQAWRLRDRFDADRGTARTWLLTLVADQVRRQRRSMSRRPVIEDADPEPVTIDVVPDLDLRAAIGRLTARQQLAVAAYYYLDLPVDQVASVMGCGVGTVKSTLHAARARLMTLLVDEPEEGDRHA